MCLALRLPASVRRVRVLPTTPRPPLTHDRGNSRPTRSAPPPIGARRGLLAFEKSADPGFTHSPVVLRARAQLLTVVERETFFGAARRGAAHSGVGTSLVACRGRGSCCEALLRRVGQAPRVRVRPPAHRSLHDELLSTPARRGLGLARVRAGHHGSATNSLVCQVWMFINNN